MEKNYLSVDMDYFFNCNAFFCLEKDFFIFRDKVNNLKKPILFFINHQDILKDINSYVFDRIYNVDYHSDIIYEKDKQKQACEGSWGNFYKYKEKAIFEWRYPDKEKCYTEGNGFCHGTTTFSKKKFPYKKVIAREGLKSIKWNTIQRVGVCLSPMWITSIGKLYYDSWRDTT